jgi:hypothetical protein
MGLSIVNFAVMKCRDEIPVKALVILKLRYSQLRAESGKKIVPTGIEPVSKV